MAPMNQFAPNDKIQWLEQRHAELIDELDALDSRLEQVVNSLAKVEYDDARGASDQ